MIWSLSKPIPAPRKSDRLPILAGLWIAVTASGALWALLFVACRRLG